MTENKAILVLADGSIFHGYSVGAEGNSVGELVFNTAMTGYQEMLTDPSYAKQLITLTTAQVGNTGCNEEDMESSQIWAAGLIMRAYSPTSFHYRAQSTLSDFLKKNQIVAMAGVDTRALTIKIRQEGAIAACISTNPDVETALQRARDFQGLQGLDLATCVSTKTTQTWNLGQGVWANNTEAPTYHVVVYDFGVKHSILRILHDRGCRLTIVPAQTPAAEVLRLAPDAVVLSNGPGDPKACDYAIAATQTFLSNDLPVFGICLGFQILALACGALTKKMPFGHHGANHPVMALQGDKRVFISSQNHGFAVDEASLPSCLEVTHKSLFDGSLQGIAHKTKKAFGFQGHPEAGPGPHDLGGLFDTFIQLMQSNDEKRVSHE